MTAPRFAFEEGKLILKDGKAGTGEACCCDGGLCPPCNFPRRLEVTVAGFPDAYGWQSFGGGSPPADGGFSPNCGESAGGGGIRFVGPALGTPSYSSFRYIDYNTTFIVEYDEDSDPCCPRWYGEFEVRTASGATGLPADAENCGTSSIGNFITLCKTQAYVTLAIGSSGPRGTGATATVTGIAGGAISAVTVTNGGFDYAYLEVIRVQPTVVAEFISSTGSGAVLSLTLEETTDEDGRPVWEVATLSLDDAGVGYESSDSIVFTVTDGDVQAEASASFRLNREEPTLGLDLPSSLGSGATFTVALTQTTDTNGEDVWAVDSVTVTNGGTGYGLSEFAVVDVIDGVEQSTASFQVLTKRVEPTVTATIPFTSGGSGVVLAVTLSATTDSSGRDAWQIASIAVTNGGTGYDNSEFVSINLVAGTLLSGASVSATVSGGVVQSVSVTSGGLYYLDSDEIEEVIVGNGGEYYKTDGSIHSVTLDSGGEYYKDEETENVIVEEINVVIESNTGTGAVLQAVVDESPESATFGQVIEITIVDGGEDYAIEGETWVLSGVVAGLNFLAGGIALGLSPDGVVCFGADQADEEQPLAFRTRLVEGGPEEDQGCGLTLLDNTYDMFYSAGIFPNAFAIAATKYALHESSGFCAALVVVDFGGGPLTLTISPA
jgi:hypothetical protein